MVFLSPPPASFHSRKIHIAFSLQLAYLKNHLFPNRWTLNTGNIGKTQIHVLLFQFFFFFFTRGSSTVSQPPPFPPTCLLAKRLSGVLLGVQLPWGPVSIQNRCSFSVRQVFSAANPLNIKLLFFFIGRHSYPPK